MNTEFKKGDRVHIFENSIFECMGFRKVSGTIILVYPDGHGFSFKCDQTGCVETCDFGDGDVSKE